MTGQDDLVGLTWTTEEGEHKPSLTELLEASSEGVVSLTPAVENHEKAERLLIRRAEIREEMTRATQPRRKLELRQELANVGRTLGKLGVPKSVRTAT